MTDPSSNAISSRLRRVLPSSRVAVVLLGVSVILGIAGPFGTLDFIRTAPRLVYWAIIVFLTYIGGSLVSRGVFAWAARRALPAWVPPVAISLGTGTLALFVVVLVNWLAMQVSPLEPGYFLSLAITTYVTATIIALMLAYLGGSDQIAEPPAPPPAPRLLDRLPLEKRGRLMSLSVADHYVEVVTSKGSDLVLMRLGDAMSETEGCAGMQVHRSHWVALDQVAAAKRTGDRAILTLKDGRDIPVSRSYVPAIKDAGLLPK